MAVPVVMVKVMAMTVGAGDGCGGSEDEASGFDAFGADQSIGEGADVLGRAAEEDDFQAAPRVEVDVGRGDDAIQVEMLQLGKASEMRPA